MLLRTTLMALLMLGALAGVAIAGELEDGIAAALRGDSAIAYQLLRPLADRGIAKAQLYLAGLYYGAQHYADAARWYRKAADQGDAEAQNNLGIMYQEGQGVPQDYAEALRLFRNAADQRYAAAQRSLGNTYKDGRGVPQDDGQAAKWLRLAADQGDAVAQFSLGVMYDIGKGVPQSDGEAAKLYRNAAERGLVQAQSVLGVMYEIGRSVPQDYVLAHMWLNLAAAQGYQDAVKNRDYLATQMTPAQIADAQKLAREWRPVIQPPKQ